MEKTGLQNIVRGCEMHGVRRLIYVTSIGVAQGAPSAWLHGRWQTEQFLFSSGLDVSVIRPGMIVGRGGTGFEAMVSGAKRPVAIGLGSGQQRMRTVAVDDLAYYLVGVLDDPLTFGHAYDVGSDDVLTTDQMTDIVAEYLGRRHPVKVHVPRTVLGLFAPLIERGSNMPRGAFKGLVDSLPVDMSGDPTPLRQLLPRPPLSYRQAVEQALTSKSQKEK